MISTDRQSSVRSPNSSFAWRVRTSGDTTSPGVELGKCTVVAFLQEVVSLCPPRQEIHIILDKLSAHKTLPVREFPSEIRESGYTRHFVVLRNAIWVATNANRRAFFPEEGPAARNIATTIRGYMLKSDIVRRVRMRLLFGAEVNSSLRIRALGMAPRNLRLIAPLGICTF